MIRHKQMTGDRRRVLATVAAAALVGNALAHDFWIEPTTFAPDRGERVGVALRVGEHFRGDRVPRDPRRIVRFAAVGASGETPVVGAAGGEPAGYARVDAPGPQWLIYSSNNAYVELDGRKFEQYLREEGLETVIAERARLGETDKPGRERYSRAAKSLIAVDGVTTGDCAVPVGLPLELTPVENPLAGDAGSELSFVLSYKGEPLAGALVVAMGASEPMRKLSARTDGDGRVSLKVGTKDRWLVKAVHMTRVAGDPKADWESTWASLTYERP